MSSDGERRGTTARLLVGGGDPDLEARLNAELGAYNLTASGIEDQQELTVRVEDGRLVAGLSGWTWGTCAGIELVWVRDDARRKGWAAGCWTRPSRSPGTAAVARSS